MSNPPATVNALLHRISSTGGRPALTWYGDDGERIELSGAVVQNWVSKTVNLLVEEFDAGPGTRVVVDLPVGWRQAVWALATARCAASLVLHDPGAGPVGSDLPDDADVVVTSRPDEWARTTADLVAVALPALARRFDGELPAGAIDAAAAVMTYGDVIGYDPAAGAPAPVSVLTVPAGGPSGAEPVGEAGTASGRVMVRGDRPVAEALASAVMIWAAGGSVVLTSAATAAGLDTDPDRLARLVATEQITAGHQA